MEKITLGGERLGSGKKNQIELSGFQRSNHNLGYIWRSTMSAGTLVPFMCEVGLPGDTIDIHLNSECLTLPTVGPLFGSYKAQFDVFQIPMRLYNSWLHNNKLNVGRNMNTVMLPHLELTAEVNSDQVANSRINASCILPYLGIRGVGTTYTNPHDRKFNGIPLLAYWEIYKQYYANKQEEIGAVIHTGNAIANPITGFAFNGSAISTGSGSAIGNAGDAFYISGCPPEEWDNIILALNGVGDRRFTDLVTAIVQVSSGTWAANYNGSEGYTIDVIRYAWTGNGTKSQISVSTFALDNIDEMRERMLATTGNVSFDVIGQGLTPYEWLNYKPNSLQYSREFSQEGLGLKTYQSDIFNNWLNSGWVTAVNSASAISTISGSFTIDELTIKKKIWELLNRVAVSGGTYQDWLSASYDHRKYNAMETPMWVGGMSKELVFQEVINNSASEGQPLGTLAGRGKYSNGKKGGKVVVKCDEHCYIMGIVSLTPRLDYSQGNRWDTGITNLDEFHKPGLDQIGFQDLITEQMAWWDTTWNDTTGQWVQQSAGKQPAWINYQTNFNRTFGNFALEDNQMFMTLNRRYEYKPVVGGSNIRDLTTYIDPVKYNYIFAETELDAQNFWMQIGVDIEARRKMSAKIMPNL